MKKIVLLFCIFLLFFFRICPLAAQANQTVGQNYIITSVPLVAKTASTLGASDELTTFQYFDGLGRPTETVQKSITPQGKDLVTLTEYDGMGRESRHWLPIIGDGSGAYLDPTAFTNNTTTLYGSETNPFYETILESSPLNRVLGQKSPGAWNSHPTENTYQTNLSTDIITNFYVNSSNQLVKGVNFSTGTLFITKAKDEDNKESYAFTDNLGRVVMKRNINVGDNVDTYYAFNDLGQLCCVIPPEASPKLTINVSDQTTINQYCYLYQYDERGNCVYKKIPGSDPIYMVYDQTNRMVLSQNGNQRAMTTKQWMVTKYDVLGRVLYTGLINRDVTPTEKDQIHANVITESVGTTHQLSNTGYTCNTFPDEITPLTVTYYDNYSFLPSGSGLIYDNSQEQNGYTAQWANASGLLTGTRTYFLDGSGSNTTAMYYDDRGRVVQSRATNHLGGYDIMYNAYNFTGQPLKTYKIHGISGATDTYKELYKYTYDNALRLLTTTHQLNGGNTVTLVSNSYDELGRLQTKNVGNIDATTYTYNIRNWTTGINGSRFSENLYYNANTANFPNFTARYNGNIAGMKWNVASESAGYDRVYSFVYDDLNRLTDAKYYGFNNGSIVSGSSDRYNEHFGFDKMGNITNFVRYGLQANNSTMIFGKVDDLTLEHSGNQLTRVTDSGSNGIFYGDEEFVKNNAISSNSCAYDANGNRLYDSNSNIWGIRYNVLNLPDAMQFYQGHQTSYTYSANGEKLKVVDKTAPAGAELPVTSLNTILTNPSVSMTTTTDYVGNMIYENGTLKRILTPEGYWQNGTYYYFLKDHLGSNRVVITGSGTVVENSSYYPSGMRFGESAAKLNNSVQPYRHTGLEMQEMHGLNWVDNNARFRTLSDGSGFTGVDPLAELYYSVSPYAYCSGNPVNRIDPTGMSENEWKPDGEHSWIAEAGDGEQSFVEQSGLSREVYRKLSNWDNGKSNDGISNIEGHTLSNLHDTFAYQLLGEAVSGKLDDGGYGPWNPDAIQIEVGVAVQLGGVANYSAGVGLITSGSHTGISGTVSGTTALNLGDLLHFKNMNMLKIGPYFSFNMFANHTNNPQSLDAYRKGGVTTTLGLGAGLTHGQAADTNAALTSGPFTPALPEFYDSYGFTLNSGFGFSRAPTYTGIWEPFK